MENAKEEFLGTLSNLYIIFLLAVLPLYNKGTYYMLGDTKYFLFRNVSLICVGIWLVLDGIFLFRKKCSIVDICMFCYGACVIVSTVFSSFRSIAWTGYSDWYMGALSQLLFVGIYFLVSRGYNGNAIPIYLAEAAFLAVTVIGFLQRLGMNPLGLFNGYPENDWVYSHMLSTLGNINWLCGHYSVMLALPMAGYLYSKKPWKQILLYIVSVLGLTLLCIQGSDSGPVIAVVGIGICLLVTLNRPERFRKALLLAIGVLVLFPVMGQLITLFEAQAATPIDGDIYAKMQWKIWWILAAFLGIVCLVLYRVNVRAQKIMIKTLLVVGAISVCGAICLVLVKWQSIFSEGWGSGRGTLWKMAWDAFAQGNWKQKLIGAGPDCYAEHLFSIGVTPTIETDGHWSGAIYANAHNEWLNHLVNLGLLGMAAYFGIFASSLKRYRGMLLGVLALGMYGVHSLVSFQQVMNTPFLFLVLGLCENRYRRAEAESKEAATSIK